jgi:RNA polymerase sigma-70 factor, ECF subfamily
MSVIRATSESELADLVERIITGDRLAEDELISRYKEGVRIIIVRIVRNHYTTEDLFQQVFKKALEKIRHGEVRDPERLSGFICGIARNIAIDHIRRARRSVIESSFRSADDIPDPAPNPYEMLLLKERAAIVRQVLLEMKIKRDRELLFRYFIGEEDKEQICAELGLTCDQFNNVLFRALKRYRDLYQKLTGEP